MTDFILTFRRRGSSDEEAQVRASIPAAVSCVEEWAEYDCALDYALAVDLVDGRRVARDATDEITELLSKREESRAREAYANPTWGDRADHARALMSE